MASDFPDLGKHTSTREHAEKLHNIVHCLTLVGPCAPIAICQHYQVPEWIPLASVGFGWGSYLYELDPNIAASDKAFPVFDEIEARNVVHQYLHLDDEVRQRLHLPIERLNRAIRRRDNADKATELRIALESLLTVDRDHDTPIAFLIRVRGSRSTSVAHPRIATETRNSSVFYTGYAAAQCTTGGSTRSQRKVRFLRRTFSKMELMHAPK